LRGRSSFLKTDIRNYFDSVRHDVLLEFLARGIKDRRLFVTDFLGGVFMEMQNFSSRGSKQALIEKSGFLLRHPLFVFPKRRRILRLIGSLPHIPDQSPGPEQAAFQIRSYCNPRKRLTRRDEGAMMDVFLSKNHLF
jgi:hypothetical protein